MTPTEIDHDTPDQIDDAEILAAREAFPEIRLVAVGGNRERRGACECCLLELLCIHSHEMNPGFGTTTIRAMADKLGLTYQYACGVVAGFDGKFDEFDPRVRPEYGDFYADWKDGFTLGMRWRALLGHRMPSYWPPNNEEVP